MRNLLFSSLLCLLSLLSGGCGRRTSESSSFKVVAYVSAWKDAMPDPQLMTHINYAFAHIAEDFCSVNVMNEQKLRDITALKRSAPDLKVLLSIGGWGSGRFSEMASSDSLRMAFADNCRALVDDFSLDGIDIDWEYPTSSAAGISSSESDTAGFTLLMRDLRKRLGPELLLTYASVHDARYIDAEAVLEYVDFVNVMSYDMGYGNNMLNAALYESSSHGSRGTVAHSLQAHLDAGIPSSKLVLGMPFYGRGCRMYDDYVPFSCNTPLKPGCRESWDDEAKEPYVVDVEGNVVLTFENERSILHKCRFIRENNCLGGMYWELGEDDKQQTLSHLVAEELLSGDSSGL